MALYYGAKAVVTTTDGEADPFELSAGVLQGDTLAPYLFVLVVDYILRHAIPDDRWHPWLYHQSTCRYPVTYIFSCICGIRLGLCNHEAAQSLLTAVEQEALSVGLKINRKMTKYMLVGDFKADSGLTVVEGPIAWVNDFKGLGSWVMSSRRDFEVRHAQAWQGCKRMYRLWQFNVSCSTKMHLFQWVCCSPVVSIFILLALIHIPHLVQASSKPSSMHCSSSLVSAIKVT